MKRLTVGDVMTKNKDGRLAGIVVRMTAATEGVVDVVHDLGYDHDDTHPTPYPRA